MMRTTVTWEARSDPPREEIRWENDAIAAVAYPDGRYVVTMPDGAPAPSGQITGATPADRLWRARVCAITVLADIEDGYWPLDETS